MLGKEPRIIPLAELPKALAESGTLYVFTPDEGRICARCSHVLGVHFRTFGGALEGCGFTEEMRCICTGYAVSIQSLEVWSVTE